METPAIVIDHFTKRYGRRTAVDNLCLEVPRGSILGLLGRNGAGKTTTLRTLMNLIAPTSGKLRVLGYDSVADSMEVRLRAGYLAEDPLVYPWMTVDELMRFSSHFYPRWDRDHAEALRKRLELPLDRRLRALSRGTQAKAALLVALAARPEVLILDDPTSGLDAVVRREFLEAIIADVQAEGGAVLFSTHMINEMERVADEVAILHEGKLLSRGPLDAVKSGFKKIRAVYPSAVPESFPVDRLVRVERNGHQAVLTVAAEPERAMAALRGAGAESVEVIDLSLEEIFVETVKGAAAHV